MFNMNQGLKIFIKPIDNTVVFSYIPIENYNIGNPMPTIDEIMDFSKWRDEPPASGAYERFFIMDNETHEWFYGLSRESFAKYVCGELSGMSAPMPYCKYEPFRDSIHHLLIGMSGVIVFDCKEYYRPDLNKWSSKKNN